MTQSPVLVTGGAGYIGSHVVKQLGEQGEKVIVLDDLSTGFRDAVLHGELVEGNTGDQALVSKLLRRHGIDTVMHFAAHTIVPESVSNPLKYYRNNTCATRNLLAYCQEAGSGTLSSRPPPPSTAFRIRHSPTKRRRSLRSIPMACPS